MAKVIWTRLEFLTWPVVFMAVAVGGALGVLSGLMMSPRNPVVVRDVHEVDGLAQRGGWLDLEFTLRRDQDCPARVERWLWQPWTGHGQSGDVPVKRWVQLDSGGANPPTPIGTMEIYVLAVPIPSAVQVGNWFYWSRTREACPWRTWLFGEKVRESRNIPVRITDPQPNTPPQVVAGGGGAVLVMPEGEKP